MVVWKSSDTFVEPLIKKLKSTTFFGRRFTRRQIAEVQQMIATFPALSRKELAQTICEHLHWHTPSGGNRVKAALGMLEQLEQAGILRLPPKRTQNMRSGPRQPVVPTRHSDPQPRIESGLRELQPLRLQLVEQEQQTRLWNEYVERHHYLGYRQPMGPHLRYFLLDRQGRQLGCLLFSQATHSLACRDAWVGWPAGVYKKHLDLVVGQPRYLLFPWVRVDNLASHALSLAVQQLPQDWQRRYGCRPVLLETVVDPLRFRGTCYRAANWTCIGQTRGRADAGRHPKDVYVYPLTKHFRTILLQGPRPQRRRKPPPPEPPEAPEANFVALWQDLLGSLSALAAEEDRRWQQRRRVLDTLLVMLFVFRLVFAPRRQGYTTTLAQLWAQCRALDVPLPQERPVSDTAMCKARPRIDEHVFKRFHAEILRRADQPGPLWLGHRVFAVDGSKLTLPRALLEAGYPHPRRARPLPPGPAQLPAPPAVPASRSTSTSAPTPTSAPPRSPISRPWRPPTWSSTTAATTASNCSALTSGAACTRSSACPATSAPAIDGLHRRRPHGHARAHPARPGHPPGPVPQVSPGTRWRPLPLRLVKYTHATTTYVLGTTVLDPQRYRVADLADLYHARWGIEEMYKISKQFLEVDQFHGQRERLVKQELYATSI